MFTAANDRSAAWPVTSKVLVETGVVLPAAVVVAPVPRLNATALVVSAARTFTVPEDVLNVTEPKSRPVPAPMLTVPTFNTFAPVPSFSEFIWVATLL